MGLSHPRFIRADVGMDGPEAVDAQTLRELQAMTWHSIEDLRQYCCIMPDSLPGHPKQSGIPCNQEAACIVCAASAHLNKPDSEPYKLPEKTKYKLNGCVEDPQSPLTEIKKGTEWHEFYLQAMQFLLQEKHTRNNLSYLGHRALPLPEIAALACQEKLNSVWVEIRSVTNQYMVRVTKDMGSKLYGQWTSKCFQIFTIVTRNA